jgi:hypothetical protein
VSRHSQAPMPESLRHFMRAGQHPARSVPCPWCRAHAHKPCRIPAVARDAQQVHQQRMAAWAQASACCPTCQVTPGVPCHTEGRALDDGRVHAARYDEADRTAA